MKAKIDQTIICIPPYISATWDQVAFMQTERDGETEEMVLLLHLSDGKVISIPHLDPSIIDIAFSAHLKHMEQRKAGGVPLFPEQIASFKIGIPGMEHLQDAMQHDLSKADTPDLPTDMLEKISGVAKLVTGGEIEAFPKPEPHCNCTHCQLARAIHGIPKEVEEIEEVHDEELTFRTWDIIQSGDHLYTVTNPLDMEEHYTVFLGSPVGCTCGKAHCEHIKAVLST